MLEARYYDVDALPALRDAPCGLMSGAGIRNEKPGAAPGFFICARSRCYGFRMRSSSALPIACVRFTTFSLRKIFCT
jgi:hypothetical protein